MNQHTIKGTLTQKMEEKQVNDNFKVKDFVIRIEGDKYPQVVKFQLINDNTQLLDFISVDDKVEVTFELRGRDYNGTIYNTLNAVKVRDLLVL